MIYVILSVHILVLAILGIGLFYLRLIWILLKNINVEGKPVIIYREHPKPRAGGLTKRPVKVNSDTSIWELEQNGKHAKSTSEIV